MKIHKTKSGPVAELEEGEIPGSIVRDGDLYFLVAGTYYLVSAVRIDQKYGLVPILDMNITDTPKGGHPLKEGAAET